MSTNLQKNGLENVAMRLELSNNHRDSAIDFESNNKIANRKDSLMSDESQKPVATCRCGHSKGHDWIQSDYSYGLLGLFGLLTFGFSAIPTKVVWRCAVCKVAVETITDPEELKRYRYREPKS